MKNKKHQTLESNESSIKVLGKDGQRFVAKSKLVSVAVETSGDVVLTLKKRCGREKGSQIILRKDVKQFKIDEGRFGLSPHLIFAYKD